VSASIGASPESLGPGAGGSIPEPGASDSEGGEEDIATDSATWADEAAWAADMSSLVLVFGPVGRGGEYRKIFWTREPA